MTYRVLLVCMGNICRSPTAEGVLRQMIRMSRGFGNVVTVDQGDILEIAPLNESAFLHQMATEAILAQIVATGLGRNCGFEHAKFLINPENRLALLCSKDFVGTLRPAQRNTLAELLAHRLATNDLQRFDVIGIFDLIEIYRPFTDGAGDHHPGQCRHGHLMHAERKLPCLLNGVVFLLGVSPINHAGPQNDQDQPNA